MVATLVHPSPCGSIGRFAEPRPSPDRASEYVSRCTAPPNVNGLSLYYEVEGEGEPLVFIPPAFGFAGLKSFPPLVATRTVITPDLQGHGLTADVPERPLSIERHAEDVVALLR